MPANYAGEKRTTREGGSYVVLVGDILGSKQFPDQKVLFDRLHAQFDWVNERASAVQPLRFTVGDEFQAVYETLAAAFRAVILLRLRFKSEKLLKPARAQDVRIGMAYGEISVFSEDRAPFGQSGEAWWQARAGMELAESPSNARYRPHASQTRFVGPDAQTTAMANAFWLAFDQVMYGMDRTDVHIALLTLEEEKQSEIARRLKISQPNVSRRSKKNGIYTVARILEQFEGLVE